MPTRRASSGQCAPLVLAARCLKRTGEANDARRRIEVEGFGHGGQPIPAASRVGNIVMTGGGCGLDPETGKIPTMSKSRPN